MKQNVQIEDPNEIENNPQDDQHSDELPQQNHPDLLRQHGFYRGPINQQQAPAPLQQLNVDEKNDNKDQENPLVPPKSP